MKRDLYFVNGWVDGACAGGLSLLALVYFRFFVREVPVSSALIAAAAALNWVVNYPHFSATLYRFYRSPESRGQFLLTARVIPLLLAAAVIACLLSPRAFTPYFINVMLLWSAYHYTGQNRGLVLLYGRRTGFPMGRSWRAALELFFYATLLNQIAQLEQSSVPMPFLGASYRPLDTPHGLVSVSASLAAVAGAALAAFTLAEARRGFRPSWIMLLPGLTQLSWAVLGANVFSFLFFLPFFHGLQYLLVAWASEIHARAPERGNETQSRFLWRRTTSWLASNLAGGALLFYFLPRLCTATGAAPTVTVAALYAAVQIHHFFVDGVIWKLRKEGSASPLLTHYSSAFAGTLPEGPR